MLKTEKAVPGLESPIAKGTLLDFNNSLFHRLRWKIWMILLVVVSTVANISPQLSFAAAIQRFLQSTGI